MSVLVRVFGAKPESDEYQCALVLKKKFEEYFPPEVIGEIFIQANATLFGQTVKDVDVIMMGTLQNYSSAFNYVDTSNNVTTGDVQINSFCTVIEVKSHGTQGVLRQGTEFFVRYGRARHSVTSQSNDQKIAAKNFFEQTTNYSPFITNLIWFTGMTENDLNELLKIDENPMPTNAFANDFSVESLMQLLVWQKKPSLYKGQYVFDSRYNNCSPGSLHKQFQLFGKEKNNMGELSRKRIEQITCKSIGSLNIDTDKEQMSILRGRAGTGKTVGLIQTAIRLVDEQNLRVIILTYNKALVSDIRRLFALAELPDMFQEQCVSINTMHSFFYQIISKGIYDGNLDGEAFIKDYQEYLGELLDFLNSDGDSITVIKDILCSDYRLNWDYCLIDEAQDWLQIERDLILLIFGYDHLIVADGGQQFVRSTGICDWNVAPKRNSMKLKYCLRQKDNIIKFINHYTSEYRKNENKILSSGKMPGGKIIICSDMDKFWSISKETVDDLKSTGNIMYDMLLLTSTNLVEKNPRKFKLTNEFEKHNIFLWDGTNELVRSDYSISGDDARVLQYDSARGLEAWTVVCLEYDTFIEEKMSHYKETNSTESMLILESSEEKRIKFMLNWALIPFTRAIDTLIITLKDKSSQTGAVLKQIADENPDYITFI